MYPKSYTCLRQTLTLNKEFWYILPENLKEFAFLHVRQHPSDSYKPKDIPKLYDVAFRLIREQRKQKTLRNKTDYIEGTNIHNTHPKLYKFCLSIKIYTIHQLHSFVEASRFADTRLRAKLSQLQNLVDFYDDYYSRKTPNR